MHATNELNQRHCLFAYCLRVIQQHSTLPNQYYHHLKMDKFQSSFSDDSLMVHNEEAQLTTAESPVKTATVTDSLVALDGDDVGNNVSLTSGPCFRPSPALVEAEDHTDSSVALDGDGVGNSVSVGSARRIGQSPALIEAEAYADSLARSLISELQRAPLNATEDNNIPVDSESTPEPAKPEPESELESELGPAKTMEFNRDYSDDSLLGQNDGGQAQGESHATSADLADKPELEPAKTVEFTKNYLDDSLMGQNDGGRAKGVSHATSADLVDFELPPYSGSSSGSSEPAPRQQSPTSTNEAQSSATSSQSACLSPPSLTALRDLLKSNYSRVSHIFHWKKPIESGVCFAIGVSLIIALTFFSIISVVAYSTLGLMLASGSTRLYKTIMKTLNRSTDTPVDGVWNQVQALNVNMSHEKMHELVDSSLGNLNASLTYFKQVLLVQDKVATLKFGAFIYFLTYIGAWFNGMTLITIGYLGLFSVPIMYEKNKTKIDEILNLATGHFCSATSMITNKVGSLVSGSSASAVKKQN